MLVRPQWIKPAGSKGRVLTGAGRREFDGAALLAAGDDDRAERAPGSRRG
jgi:hypothetical protein